MWLSEKQAKYETVHTTTMQKKLFRFQGPLLAVCGSNSIQIEGFGAKQVI